MELCNGQIKYLIAIKRLSDSGKKVKCATIADYLHVSRPSVSKTLRCLAECGLVYKNFCNSVEFTAQGQETIKVIMKNYDEIYTFFRSFIKLGAEQAREHTVKFITDYPQTTCDRMSELVKLSLKHGKYRSGDEI